MTTKKFYFLDGTVFLTVFLSYLYCLLFAIFGALVIYNQIEEILTPFSERLNHNSLLMRLILLFIMLALFSYGVIGLFNSHSAIYSEKILSNDSIAEKKLRVKNRLKEIASLTELEPNYYSGGVDTKYPVYKSATIDIFLTEHYYLLRIAPSTSLFRHGSNDFGAGRHCRRLVRKILTEKTSPNIG